MFTECSSYQLPEFKAKKRKFERAKDIMPATREREIDQCERETRGHIDEPAKKEQGKKGQATREDKYELVFSVLIYFRYRVCLRRVYFQFWKNKLLKNPFTMIKYLINIYSEFFMSFYTFQLFLILSHFYTTEIYSSEQHNVT